MRQIAGWLTRGANGDHVVIGPVVRDATQFSFAVAVGKSGGSRRTLIESTLDEGESDLAKLRNELRQALARRRGLTVHEADDQAAMTRLVEELL
jgi:uncharacterized protein with GYD domain